MIEIENELFTTIATALRTAYSGIYVSGEYVEAPARFPAVSIVEMDNTIYRGGIDSGSMERYADVMFQVDVYSNKSRGRKAECKAIAALVDSEFARLGFRRSFLTPTQNVNDATIYRMTGRYVGVVSEDHLVYGG